MVMQSIGQNRKLLFLNYLCSSPNIVRVMKSRRMRWAGHVARIGDERCIEGLVGNPEGKSPLGRPSRRWEDNIKIDLQEAGWEAWNRSIVEQIYLAQDRDRWRAVANAVRVP